MSQPFHIEVSHRRVLAIALPIMLANVSQPLSASSTPRSAGCPSRTISAPSPSDR
jgi:hypothetical protein